MKDFLGKELNVEDTVVFTFHRNALLYKGKIFSIKPKTVILVTNFNYHCVIRKSNVSARIIKIE